MKREGMKDLAVSVLAVVAVALAAECAYLHVKVARQAEVIAELEAKVEAIVNPPPKPTLGEQAKGAYERAKTATVRQYERVKTAVAEGYEAAKGKLEKK